MQRLVSFSVILKLSCKEIFQFCDRMKRLLQVQEEKMGPEVLAVLGFTPWSIPTTLQVDHAWKAAFDLPSDWGNNFGLSYLSDY